MPLSADQVATVVALLLPGFILMKIFYFFGLRTRQQDAQWYMWSILLGAPFAAVAGIIHPPPASWQILGSGLAYAAFGGVFAVLVWRYVVVKTWPGIRVMATVGAWDTIFGRTGNTWLQISTSDGRVLIGWPQYVGQLSDSTDPDMYLRDVAEVVDGKAEVIASIEGLLLTRSNIKSIYVFNPED